MSSRISTNGHKVFCEIHMFKFQHLGQNVFMQIEAGMLLLSLQVSHSDDRKRVITMTAEQ